MLKQFDESNTLPEYPEIEIVEEFTNFVLDNSASEMRNNTLYKLEIISDKQYHTYSQPSVELKDKIQKWIIQNWVDNTNEFLESILLISYSFALEKTIFVKALDLIKEDQEHQKKEWIESLENADEHNMNPWWDLKEKNE